jgi:quercetin dioxygenase-like cupin family protein
MSFRDPELVAWRDVETQALTPLIQRQFISTERVTIARFLLKKGMVVPEHSHENEQVAYVLEGALKFIFRDRDVTVRTGEMLVIPAHVPHAATALEDTIDLDIFAPARADWAAGDDSYLRSGKNESAQR